MIDNIIKDKSYEPAMYKSITILLIAVTFVLITPILKPVYAQTQNPCANPTIIGTDNMMLSMVR